MIKAPLSKTLISTRRMALNILYDYSPKISLYDCSWFVSHEHQSIIISRCMLLQNFLPCGINSG